MARFGAYRCALAQDVGPRATSIETSCSFVTQVARSGNLGHPAEWQKRMNEKWMRENEEIQQLFTKYRKYVDNRRGGIVTCRGCHGDGFASPCLRCVPIAEALGRRAKTWPPRAVAMAPSLKYAGREWLGHGEYPHPQSLSREGGAGRPRERLGGIGWLALEPTGVPWHKRSDRGRHLLKLPVPSSPRSPKAAT